LLVADFVGVVFIQVSRRYSHIGFFPLYNLAKGIRKIFAVVRPIIADFYGILFYATSVSCIYTKKLSTVSSSEDERFGMKEALYEWQCGRQ
jgi:hypothetical protein